MDLLDTLIPASRARLQNARDILDDMEACNFAIRCGGDLVCIVDADDWSCLLYDDGEFARDRKFTYAPMFATLKSAERFITKLSYCLGGVRRVPVPRVISVPQAAAARLAHHETMTHEWGE